MAAAAHVVQTRSHVQSARCYLAIAGLGVAFLDISAVVTLAVYPRGSDLDIFRIPMAEAIVFGHPLNIYAISFFGFRSDNGPVSLVPLSLVTALINDLGLVGSIRLRAAVIMAFFALFSLLMAQEAVRAVGRHRQDGVHPILRWAPFLIAPPLWIALARFGHVELAIEVWLMLIAVRLAQGGSSGRAGIFIGLAALTRTSALVAALPVVLLLLSERRFGAVARMGAISVLTAGLGLLPFLVADPHDVIQSLIGYRANIPGLGGSFWLPILSTPVGGVIQHGDALIFGVVAVGLLGAAVRLRPEKGLSGPHVYGLMAVAAACIPLLAKTVWPYYLVDPFVYASIWWLARPRREVGTWRMVAPILLAACSILLTIVTPANHPPIVTPTRVTVGIVSSLLVAAAMSMVLWDWFRPQREPAQAPVEDAVPSITGSLAREGLLTPS